LIREYSKEKFLNKEPEAEKYFWKFISAYEFLNNTVFIRVNHPA
jgi:hypothetical protein